MKDDFLTLMGFSGIQADTKKSLRIGDTFDMFGTKYQIVNLETGNKGKNAHLFGIAGLGKGDYTHKSIDSIAHQLTSKKMRYIVNYQRTKKPLHALFLEYGFNTK